MGYQDVTYQLFLDFGAMSCLHFSPSVTFVTVFFTPPLIFLLNEGKNTEGERGRFVEERGERPFGQEKTQRRDHVDWLEIT